MSFKFSKKSKLHLETCHISLQKIMLLAIFRSKIDFGISEGFRSVDRQNKLFHKKLTKIDGINKKGKHNLSPSQAVDIFAYSSNCLLYTSPSPRD